MPKVLPVIHHLDAQTTLAEAALAFRCGADGVFLISHHGQCMDLLELARVVKARAPEKLVGVNLLSKSCLTAYDLAAESRCDMVWSDNVGVSSIGVTQIGWQLADRLTGSGPKLLVFGSVAFKYQPNDPFPAVAARMAADLGMVPTTSGVATGVPPTVEKIAAMSMATDGLLAVASGMTCENVEDYASHLSHIMVSTGVSVDDYHFDRQKLSDFVRKVNAKSQTTLSDAQHAAVERVRQLPIPIVLTAQSALGKAATLESRG